MNDLQAPAILSLFDHSGVWSRPYRDAGYRVVQVDLAAGFDVLSIETFAAHPRALLRSLGNIRGVIAQPPCTQFAASGARWWAAKDLDEPQLLAPYYNAETALRHCPRCGWPVNLPIIGEYLAPG